MAAVVLIPVVELLLDANLALLAVIVVHCCSLRLIEAVASLWLWQPEQASAALLKVRRRHRLLGFRIDSTRRRTRL